MEQRDIGQQVEQVKDKVNRLERFQKVARITHQKLKLTTNDEEARFNKKIKIMKNLGTFVDIRKQIQELNIFNKEEIIRKIQQYKENSKICQHLKEQQTQADEKKELEITQNLKNQHNGLYRKYLRGKFKLYLLDRCFQADMTQETQLSPKKKHSVKVLSLANKLVLDKQQQLTAKDNQIDEVYKLFQVKNNSPKSNCTPDQFYQCKTERSQKVSRQTKLEQNNILSTGIQKTDKLYETIKSFGIDINDEDCLSKERLYNQYKEKTEKLIQKIQGQAERQILVTKTETLQFPKNMCLNKPLLSTIIEKELKEKNMIKNRNPINSPARKADNLYQTQPRVQPTVDTNISRVNTLPKQKGSYSISKSIKSTSLCSSPLHVMNQKQQISNLSIPPPPNSQRSIQQSFQSIQTVNQFFQNFNSQAQKIENEIVKVQVDTSKVLKSMSDQIQGVYERSGLNERLTSLEVKKNERLDMLDHTKFKKQTLQQHLKSRRNRNIMKYF